MSYRRLATSFTIALFLIVGISARANAAFFAAICNDLACSGGDDVIVQDGSGLDTIAGAGAINFTISAFNYSLVVNTSQSKPVIGTATAPQLDLAYVATTPTGTVAPTSVFLFASDTDFLNTTPLTGDMTLAGTNSGGSGSETARVWGGTNNTALSFSGANLIATLGPLSGAAVSAETLFAFTPTVSPYSLTLGVAITRSTAGTSTGDLNATFTPVPEPATMSLLGTGLFGIAAAIRRRRKAQL